MTKGKKLSAQMRPVLELDLALALAKGRRAEKESAASKAYGQRPQIGYKWRIKGPVFPVTVTKDPSVLTKPYERGMT